MFPPGVFGGAENILSDFSTYLVDEFAAPVRHRVWAPGAARFFMLSVNHHHLPLHQPTK
jgi:hypothetical protein